MPPPSLLQPASRGPAHAAHPGPLNPYANPSCAVCQALVRRYNLAYALVTDDPRAAAASLADLTDEEFLALLTHKNTPPPLALPAP